MRSDEHSTIAWVVLAVFVIIVEAYLWIVRDHTFSEQMRYWIRYSKLGSVLVMFWIWVTYHFVIEPIVRYTAKLFGL